VFFLKDFFTLLTNQPANDSYHGKKYNGNVFCNFKCFILLHVEDKKTKVI